MLRLKLIAAFLLILSVIGGACGSPAGTTPTTSTNPVPPLTVIKLSADIQPVFNANCVTCHQGAAPQGGMTLETGKAFASLVNVKSAESALMRVKPGAPSESYLIFKLEGTQTQVGGSGAQMPFNGIPLPAAQIELIRRWISQGAPNN